MDFSYFKSVNAQSCYVLHVAKSSPLPTFFRPKLFLLVPSVIDKLQHLAVGDFVHWHFKRWNPSKGDASDSVNADVHVQKNTRFSAVKMQDAKTIWISLIYAKKTKLSKNRSLGNKLSWETRNYLKTCYWFCFLLYRKEGEFQRNTACGFETSNQKQN